MFQQIFKDSSRKKKSETLKCLDSVTPGLWNSICPEHCRETDNTKKPKEQNKNHKQTKPPHLPETHLFSFQDNRETLKSLWTQYMSTIKLLSLHNTKISLSTSFSNFSSRLGQNTGPGAPHKPVSRIITNSCISDAAELPNQKGDCQLGALVSDRAVGGPLWVLKLQDKGLALCAETAPGFTCRLGRRSHLG